MTDVAESRVSSKPQLPPAWDAHVRDLQEQLRSGTFTLDHMPGYKPGEPPSIDTWHNTDYLDIYPKVWGRECGKNGIGKLREVVLTEITEYEKFAYYDLDPAYFPRMGAHAYGEIDIAKMRDQSLQYQAAMESAGVTVHRIRFPEPHVSAYGPAKSNWGAAELLVLRGGSVLPKRGVNPFGYGRAEFMALWAMANLGIPVQLAITGKGVCEAGPSFFLAEDVFVTGRGVAFNQEGLDQLLPVVQRSTGLSEDDFTALVIDFPSPYYFDPQTGVSHHPDMVLGPLDVDKVVAYPAGLDFKTWRWLKEHGYTIIEVERDEQVRYAPANVMILEPGVVIMHAEAPRAIAAVRAAGVEVIPVEYSEFLAEAGGLHCSTGQLYREPGPYSTDR
jgi:N-dimethylarginine dimethylaminohydrolase